MDFMERFNKSYIEIIKRNSYLSTFVKELKPVHETVYEITQDDIDILHRYMWGISPSKIISKYRVTNLEYEVYRTLNRVLNLYAISGYKGSLICLKLPNRIQNALLRGGIFSVSQVEEYLDKGDLSSTIRGIGKGSDKLIKESLDRYNTSLKSSDELAKEVSNYTRLLTSKSKGEAIDVLLDVLKEKGEYSLVEAYNELYG